MEYDTQKYSLLADMDSNKIASGDIYEEISAVNHISVQRALQKYFNDSRIKESWVAQDPSVVRGKV